MIRTRHAEIIHCEAGQFAVEKPTKFELITSNALGLTIPEFFSGASQPGDRIREWKHNLQLAEQPSAKPASKQHGDHGRAQGNGGRAQG
jgi:hypothetical protein